MECHDNDGRGGIVRDDLAMIPDFTDARWHATRSDAELARSILEGKGKSMPRMKKKLGSVDVQQVVSFIRAFRGGKQVVEDEPELPSAPAQSPGGTASAAAPSESIAHSSTTTRDQNTREGRRLFQRFCARCHGSDGRGTAQRESLPRLPDFTRGAWQAGRSDAQLVVSVLDGKRTEMPSFRDRVAREGARALVAYIRTFAPSPRQTVSAGVDEFEVRFRELEREFESLRRQSGTLSSATSRTSSGPPASTPRPASTSNPR
jgi:mono/diheme cytochrome c family protein